MVLIFDGSGNATRPYLSFDATIELIFHLNSAGLVLDKARSIQAFVSAPHKKLNDHIGSIEPLVYRT